MLHAKKPVLGELGKHPLFFQSLKKRSARVPQGKQPRKDRPEGPTWDFLKEGWQKKGGWVLNQRSTQWGFWNCMGEGGREKERGRGGKGEGGGKKNNSERRKGGSSHALTMGDERLRMLEFTEKLTNRRR